MWHPFREARRPLPDCQYIYDQLRSHGKVHLTLTRLWLEYKEAHPDGYQYTQFCGYYRRWRDKLDSCMRQEHRGGEKLFVDYSDGLAIVDPGTGELLPTQLFVAVWGASNYTYAEASLSQELACWIGAHVRAFEYFGCGPRMVVPDNLKSGVSKSCFYEPELNPTYADLAARYGCAVLPARPYRPRDKAKVEVGVLIAQRWILAMLRPGNVHSAQDWLEVLEPIVARYERSGVRRYFRADAAFASPEVYEYLEGHGFLYAIRLPSNDVLEREIEPLLTRPVGRPPEKPIVWYHDFPYQAGSWDRPRRVVAKVEWHRGELFPRVGFIVTNLSAQPEGVVHFYNGRGTAEQWIKEGKYALNWTRLSCHRFVANQVRLQLFLLAYNLGNFLRRLALPKAVRDWSLRSLQLQLIKIGGRVVRHARRVVFQLTEVAVSRDLFAVILDRVSELRLAPG